MKIDELKPEKAAVLIVALIMLAMVTFLVVAFVGFARFERASVASSLRQTEVSFISGSSQSIALTNAMNSIFTDKNGTASLRVSIVSSVNQQAPVYIDSTGDGVQDTNSTYLNLNAERNNPLLGGDPFFQPSDPATGVFGDPEWIGLLENPNEPHSSKNRFVARMAYLTVPVSEILNVRYNHRFGSLDLASHDRGQGDSPHSINLAAPLFHMHPELFSNPSYDPSLYAGAMHELGAAVGDAYFYGRPSFGFKQARIENKSTPVSFRAHQAAEKLLTEKDLAGGSGGSLNTWFRIPGDGKKPYGLYKFLGTFSAAELPEEKTGFDLSSIRDESTYGYAFPVVSPYDQKSAIKFLNYHGLKSGDKIVPDSLGPHIVDPIRFDLITPETHSPTEIKELLVRLVEGGDFETNVPHRLNPLTDYVKMVVSGLPDNWRILVRANTNAPWVKVPTSNIVYHSATQANPFHWSTQPSVMLNSPATPSLHQFSFQSTGEMLISSNFRKYKGNAVEYCWGYYDSDTREWIRQLSIPEDPGEDLPAALGNIKCELVYRPQAVLADNIPYYVKVWDQMVVSLHRSAQLDDLSRVNFTNKVGAIPSIIPGNRVGRVLPPNISADSFEYDSTTGQFTLLNTSFNRWANGDYVRFISTAQLTVGADGAMGGNVYSDQVFYLQREGSDLPPRFILQHTERPYVGSPVRLINSGTHTLELVHKFKIDGLTDAVEKMAGNMLNESIDTIGQEAGGSHQLGGASLPLPDPAAPFPLVYGIGAHHKSKGQWHKANKGIPWGRGSSSVFSAKGSYTTETERILQVAANIGDVYSEPPVIEITGKDIIRSSISNNYMAFGQPSADGLVSAEIRYNLVSMANGRPAGIDYGPYRVFFEPSLNQSIDSIIQKGYVSGVIVLEKRSFMDNQLTKLQTRRIAESSIRRLKLAGVYPANNGAWKWNLKELVWKNGLSASKGNLGWVGLNLAIEMESGRFVEVYLNGKKVLNYSSAIRVEPKLKQSWITTDSGNSLRQAALWAEAKKGIAPDPIVDDYFFTLVHPAVTIADSVFQKSRNIQLPPSLSTGWTYEAYTKFLSNYQYSFSGIYPTAYEGVFDRDNSNNIYLTGLQRRDWFTGDDPATSWYRRGAPKIIGVKDRGIGGNDTTMGGYKYRMPALSEVSLRLTYDRKNNKVMARLAMEVNMPPAGLLPSCQLKIKELTLSGNGIPEYRDVNGFNAEDGAAFPVNGNINTTLNLSTTGSDISAVLLSGTLPNGFNRVLSDPATGAVKSLADIKFSDMQVSFKAQIIAGGSRVVDFFDGTLVLPPASLGNPMANHELFAPVWNATDAVGYAPGKVVLDPVNYNYYRLRPDGSGLVKPPATGWAQLIGRKFRKIDLSSQVNDPLVNGSQRGWQTRVYAPTYVSGGKLVSNLNETKVLWSPAADPEITPGKIYTAASFAGEFGRSLRHHFGVNLGAVNDAYQPWGRTNTGGKNDPSIKDPAINPKYNPANWWTFPDVLRGGIKSVGWLGQVHRGTPWQTLYLKSKSAPGVIEIQSIDDRTGVITTAEPHNLRIGDIVGFSGDKPDSWTGVTSLNGEVYPVKEVIGLNQYTLWNTSLGDYAVQGYNQQEDGFYPTPGLSLDSMSWAAWAGSFDTKPVNDRRLLEAFYVSNGSKLRGRLSVNNRTIEAWSGVLDGVAVGATVISAPYRRIGSFHGGNYDWNSSPRLPANKVSISTRKGAADKRWNLGILGGIAAERQKGRFKRTTDILEASQLTDQSPYLPSPGGVVNPGQVDELDIERIPMQILSLLKAGGPKRYQMYIFTQQLKPARRYQLPGKKGGPGFDDDGNVFNYEVVSQTAQRVLVELIGAEEWHESLKSGHYGQYRDVDGSLKDLPKPYPKIIRKYPIDMGY